MPKYEDLSPALTERMEQDRRKGTLPAAGFRDYQAIRRNQRDRDKASVWRPAFAHDIDKILHCPYYNRCTDKTQVFSLIRNDDITRRSLHVQLVSRIARTIGSALNLNLELIEAIALGHDIGHPPFAHAGEEYLDELYYESAGRHFRHNIHSVRVLDGIYPFNITLQTLSGIAGHNGEIELEEYRPEPIDSFRQFDHMLERSYLEKAYANRIQPSTLEGCVVRVADIIAYLGKDRQDAARVNIVPEEAFANEDIGSINAEIIQNLVVNIIENSYGRSCIKLDSSHFRALQESKRDNYARIYAGAPALSKLDTVVKPMMKDIYGQMLSDLKTQRRYSPIFRHHIDYVNQSRYRREVPYESTLPDQLVVDYIASMTDDYLIDLHHYLFPDSPLRVEYRGYFDEM